MVRTIVACCYLAGRWRTSVTSFFFTTGSSLRIQFLELFIFFSISKIRLNTFRKIGIDILVAKDNQTAWEILLSVIHLVVTEEE